MELIRQTGMAFPNDSIKLKKLVDGKPESTVEISASIDTTLTYNLIVTRSQGKIYKIAVPNTFWNVWILTLTF